jgi:phosphoribosylformylglycinamidine synthase PurS subunit
MKAKVIVMPRGDVLDPQGKAVSGALHAMGYSGVEEVRVGKLIELDLGGVSASDAETQVNDMCQKLLANTVIEDYTFTLEN